MPRSGSSTVAGLATGCSGDDSDSAAPPTSGEPSSTTTGPPTTVHTARLSADPFTLGVASGYPTPEGVILWTRLAPEPLAPGGGMPAEVVAVRWVPAPAAA